ncbi:MAG TPA: excinuclease ABC subunit A, partial [Verrucomicrobiae bacterium]|nr:excinuclease ABC subunit A [Verrucomicrobiae bacterium]
MASHSSDFILIEGARQNNLKGINLKLPLGELMVVTGVSGSGKSSLAFDTIYAEGQRRYVETFSPYARQFLDRMDKPKVDSIEGIPPSIAIDQTNTVKTSRSTVGTMTELNDHLKLLFARAAQLFCRQCGKPVRRDTPQSCYEQCALGLGQTEALITFPVYVPASFSLSEAKELLAKQGYHKFLNEKRDHLEVIQDRVAWAAKNRLRIVESMESAMKAGQGRLNVWPQGAEPEAHGPVRFSADLHCPDCDIHYRDPVPSLFSFNSPIGACETCRGFGRTIGIDCDLVIPDDTKTLAGGAVKPWQTESFRDVQEELLKHAHRRGVPADVPWSALLPSQRDWVIDGEGEWEDGHWFGARRFFRYLETKSYRMHIRVLLSKYRAYTLCPDCQGARLKPEALRWRVGEQKLSVHDVMLLPIDQCLTFFESVALPAPLD